ncbi:molybdopterin cofactor-binding domain-containing protein [Oceanicella sp. SM1341]|uniref:xanthine dehydrogenase family protein molybdopterin-binding subunit n=1 Tax=Oceanicella sp. SM1341 TaxID=1548889 RepID=UPI001E4F1883|nr:molybdopterin cofactor-binding domain-containing protein [Oceanicella sp. SM1341]
MTQMFDLLRRHGASLSAGTTVNLSRRGFLGAAGATAGALVLGVGLPSGRARAQAAGAADSLAVPAFLEIRPDGTVHLMSPFMEGGQGIYTALAQIVGEELDADPATFVVEAAPANDIYKVMDIGMRITGGSMSVRFTYTTMRRLGALARAMLVEAAAQRLSVPASELTTEPGRVVHAASGRSLGYGELSDAAMDLPVPAADSVTLRDAADFRWIGKPVARLDMHDKSTGRAIYAIDTKVEGMLQAAVQHAPRYGMSVGTIRNRAAVEAMPGVHSVHELPGAVAVVADLWWRARRAVESLQVTWQEAPADSALRVMPADFSSEAFAEQLAAESGPVSEAETEGDFEAAFGAAETTVTATYRSQFVHHGQLEPPSALAQFNDDGSLELWLPNQAPEMFRDDVARRTGLEPAQVHIHSPLLGGFFGRHFLYEGASPYPQAIALAQAVGRPVKVIWSREEEFLRDPLRPMAVVQFRGALGADGMPVAIEAISATEGPTEGVYGRNPEKIDETALEGLTGKAYAVANRRIGQRYVKGPAMLAYWRSVGNSMNDFFYETFLDEMADAGGQDPYAVRAHLLRDNARLTTLLDAVVDLSGGWQRGPFTAPDGSRRARGIAMASPFGTETASIAEVSIEGGEIRVHDVWQAMDPGSIVNPAIIEAQVNSAVALGLSMSMLEEAIYEKGEPVARNYDLYPILTPDRMPRVQVRIIESGAKMGGVGEPGLPSVPPAVANAVARLTGQRPKAMPFSRMSFAT